MLVLETNTATSLEVPVTAPLIDTIGAGDIFAGSMLHALNQGSTIAQAVDLAIERASQSTRYAGAIQGPLNTLAEQPAPYARKTEGPQ